MAVRKVESCTLVQVLIKLRREKEQNYNYLRLNE